MTIECNPAMGLPLRAFHVKGRARQWNLLWETGPYLRRFTELLLQSRNFVLLLGWQLDSRLRLPAPDDPRARKLRDLLRTHCEANPDFHAYLLLWEHPTFYLPIREWWQRSLWSRVHPRVHFRFDGSHPLGACHHEKLIVFDGRAALCGGVDLCDGRWDSPHHRFRDPLRSLAGKTETHGPYHDLSVEVHGPIVQVLWDHAAWRWNRVEGVRAPSPPHREFRSTDLLPKPLLFGTRGAQEPAGESEVYLSRTSSLKPAVFGPTPSAPFPQIREAEASMRTLVRLSKRRILIESQYFWSPAFARELVRRIRSVPRKGAHPFRVEIILADLRRIRGLSRMMADRTYSLLLHLKEAAEGNPNVTLEMTHPQACRAGGPSRPVYVHSKLMIVDDRWLSVGSVNLADRAFRLDSELQLTFEAETEEQRARIDAIAHHVSEHWRRPPGILLKPIEPAALRRRFRRLHPLLWRLPWHHLVDPRRPWLEGLVRAIARLPIAGRLILGQLRLRDSGASLSSCVDAPTRTKNRRNAPRPFLQHAQGIQHGKPPLRPARDEAGDRGSWS